MDMWPAYSQAKAECLPRADTVYDRFHVSKHLNEAVDKVRRREHRQLQTDGDTTLAGTKYLWMSSRIDFRTSTGRRFRALLRADLLTATAWSLKENFRHFWKLKRWARACQFLQDWLEAARDTRLKPLEKVADMIDKHGEGLLNYTLHRITNAMSEGLNCAIQLLKSCAKGLPNFASLRARVLFFEGKLELHPA